jgi:hypothetical protein
METTLQALIVKKFKDAEADLDIGRHWIDETSFYESPAASSATRTGGLSPRSVSR